VDQDPPQAANRKKSNGIGPDGKSVGAEVLSFFTIGGGLESRRPTPVIAKRNAAKQSLSA
jgi:hypothetical protein